MDNDSTSITTKPMMTECCQCSSMISVRATICPSCDSIQTKPCSICNNLIPIDSTACPECGDPDPFAPKEAVELNHGNDNTNGQGDIATLERESFQSNKLETILMSGILLFFFIVLITIFSATSKEVDPPITKATELPTFWFVNKETKPLDEDLPEAKPNSLFQKNFNLPKDCYLLKKYIDHYGISAMSGPETNKLKSVANYCNQEKYDVIISKETINQYDRND
ncbi:zinc ribbon domain-containing protein [Desulfogranum marinum]|uniref:zinc ribbon domain-containing protein n=1 Tax=Desulfogranum marinum TaxID=453220 RepID=UPI0019667DEC|nr:zinc ribbon domain-containing protein [Desulfogranum marinum]MBM9515284.1 zinc ribbon domain-containing protein [Desulfogranum marinum]